MDSLKTTINNTITTINQPSLPRLVETESSLVDSDDTLSMSTLDPIISSDTESPEPVLSMPSTAVSPIVPRLVETPTLLDTEIPQNTGKAALPTTNVTPKLTPLVLPVL